MPTFGEFPPKPESPFWANDSHQRLRRLAARLGRYQVTHHVYGYHIPSQKNLVSPATHFDILDRIRWHLLLDMSCPNLEQAKQPAQSRENRNQDFPHNAKSTAP